MNQSKPISKNVFKVNLLSVSARLLSGFYERKVSQRLSVQLGGNYQVREREIIFSRSTLTKAYTFIPEVRIYSLARHQAPKGVYLASFARYRYLEMETENSGLGKEYGKIKSYGGGVLAGVHALFLDDHLSLDCFLGPHLTKHDFEGLSRETVKYDYFSLLFNTLDIRFGITAGIAF
ncbi:DUF3575 domain-containing protein [Rhodocytophaga aerolata]|uniref:DUF3575 domain-containing protein n=2 Tax=Rhodocytophaga aerolata TaxID=455078 RepID=A0ABT8RI68_9BACT|nr:DUF3575 domain-containing protein [Rhodocytophaga aerolata]MDO1451807.1 DUF3575 domain-containing protein [Rhodocytophaga aerolata]